VSSISDDVQERWFKFFCKEGIPHNKIIGISSEPTDALAMMVASTLFSKAIKRGEYVLMVNLSETYSPEPCKALFIYNITDHITVDRTMKLRDIVTKYLDTSTLFLIIGGIDAYSFFSDMLRHPVDYILHPINYFAES